MAKQKIEKSDFVSPSQMVAEVESPSIPRLVWLVLVLAIVGAGAWGVTSYFSQTPPLAQDQASDPIRQVTAEGVVSLDALQALASFNFPKPLPFFVEHNVLQAVTFEQTASSTSPSNPFTYIKYRILEADHDVVCSAYVEYFADIGWELTTAKPCTNRQLSFRAPQSLGRIEVIIVNDANQQATNMHMQREGMVALSLLRGVATANPLPI